MFPAYTLQRKDNAGKRDDGKGDECVVSEAVTVRLVRETDRGNISITLLMLGGK